MWYHQYQKYTLGSEAPCQSSKTKGINIALGNDYLASQGLASLRGVWINIHYGR
ncbi:hypothetical protein PPRY_a0596 [Pseudoalteromonas prydzensis ACAM 620]|nr:hypothetical protein [Pseudoalteromonas prydzensis ACAM 620]